MGHDYPALAIAGLGVFSLWAVALSYFDLRYQRLPNALTLPALILAVAVALIVQPAWLWGMALWAGLYFLLALFGGGEAARIGGGDLKLAVPLGIGVAAWGGLLGVAVAIVAAQLITLATALCSWWWLNRKQKPKQNLKQYPQQLPHGPAMVLGALIGALLRALLDVLIGGADTT